MPGNTDPKVNHVAIKVGGSYLVDTKMDKLVDVEVDSTLHMPTMFTIRFHDDELELVDSSIFALGGEIEIEFPDPTSQSGTLISAGKGEITSIEPEFNENNTVTLTIRGFDKLHRLTQGTKQRTFLNMTDSDMVRKVIGEAGLQAGTITATSVVYEHVFQHNLTNLEFLHDRAYRNGFDLYIDKTGNLNFCEAKSSSPTIDLKWGITLRSFRPRASGAGQVKDVTVRSWNIQNKQAIVGTKASATNSPATSMGAGTAAATKYRQEAKLADLSPVSTASQAEKLAQSVLDDVNAGYLEAEGVAFGNPKILAGVKVKIAGVGTQFSGTYFVSSAVHRYSHDTGYDTYFKIEGSRPHLMADQLTNAPDRSIPSLVQGIVTNNKDPKGWGRVKVKFPWMSDELESTWARVIATGAGAQRGIYWLPEVNDEVAVGFEQGDFNFPYVLGGVWNGSDATPKPVAETVKGSDVVLRVLQTKKHVIMLQEEASKEIIEIKDIAGKTIVRLTAKPKPLIEILTSEGDVTVKAVNINVEATGQLKVKGKTVDINADTTMNIKGQMVNIN